MSAKRKDDGSVPLDVLAKIESGQHDIHYIREQTDRDRRSEAEKHRDLELKVDKLRDVQTKHGEQLAAIYASTSTLKWMIATIVPAAVGIAYTAGRLFH